MSDADYYLEYAARVEATSPALAELLRKRAAALGEPRVRAGAAGVSPSPGTATVRQRSAPPFAYRSVVIPSEDRATGPIGRERDIQSSLWGFQDKLGEVEQGLVDYYMIQDGMAPDAARERAQEDIKQKVMSRRYNVEGRPEYGGMEGWLPMTRESRIITRRIQDPETGELKETDLYYDPDTKDFRPPTASEYAVEAFAKQELMGPEKIGKLMYQLRQQVSDITRQLNYDIGSPEEQAAFDEKYREVVAETFDDWFMYTKPGTAKTIETFTGAALRSWPAITSTIVNTALMGGIAGYTPLYWEQDENGQPVDPDSWAYRAHEALVEAGQAAGLSEEQARDAFTGGYELPVPYNIYDVLGVAFGPESTIAQVGAAIPEPVVPVPFQPVKRTQATAVDPYGQRVASATGNFIIDVAQNLRRGRSMGDEFMSISALAEDRRDDFYRAREGWKESSAAGKNTIYEYVGSTSPYWYGVGMEMLYGIGPFASVAKLVRSGEKGIQKAAKIANMERSSLEKLGFVVAHPIEAAARAQTMRVAGDLLEGRAVGDNPFDILEETNEVRRVVGEYGSREISTPYLMESQLNVGATGETIKGLAQGTESGDYVLRNAGIRLPDGDLNDGQVAAVRESIHRWVASAYRPEIDTILAAPGLSEAVKIERISRLLAEGGASKKVFPELGNTAGRTAAEWVEALFPPGSDVGRAALPVRSGKPVLLRIHKLGSDVVRASRTVDEAQLTGELGRIAQRRLGGDKLSPIFMADNSMSVADAVRAAGGRAIEATIENIVPDDYVFVTRTLMAPRGSLTRDVYKSVAGKVSRFEDAFTVTQARGDDGKPLLRDGRAYNDVVAKEPEREWLRSEMGRVFGVANIERAPQLDKIRRAIDEGTPITETDRAYLRDGFVTEAYREALDGAGRTGMGGAQAERAMVEGVGVGLQGAPEKRVARRQVEHLALEAIPRVISEGGGRQLMSAVRKVLRKLGAEIKEPPPVVYGKVTPLPVQRMIEKLRNRIGSISDNFQRELRDAVIDARAAGRTAEDAFNSVINTRLHQAMYRAVREVDNEADRLINVVGHSPENAYYRIAYARGGDEASAAVGREVFEPVREGVDYKSQAHQEVRAEVKAGAWREILSMFFDSADYKRIQDAVPRLTLQPGLPAVAASRAPDEYLDITTENVRRVIEQARALDPDTLGSAGAATSFMGIPTSLNQDAISQVLTAWAVGRDRGRITAQMLETLRAQHPEVWVDLMPSAYSTRPDLVVKERELSLLNRDTVYSSLIRTGEWDDAGISDITRALDDARVLDAQAQMRETVSATSVRRDFDVLTERGLVKPVGSGLASDQLDLVGARLYNGLTPMTRKSVVDLVMQDILKGGSVDIAFRNITDSVKGLRPFQIGTTTQALRALFANLELASRRGDELTPADSILLDLFTRARRTRYEKLKESDPNITLGVVGSNIIFELGTDLMRNTFDVVIAPAVQEVLSNARAMGFTPGIGPRSMSNVVREVADINPFQPSLLLMGDDYIEALNQLKGAARDGRLIENLEMLQQKDRLRKALKGEQALRGENAWEFAKNLALKVVYGSRTLAASGMLAGGYYVRGPWRLPVPAPNTRYIGMNLITAPLLALTTVGAAGALKAARGVGWGEQARDVGRQVSGLVGKKLVDAVSPRAADDVVFTTVTGRKWTWAELQAAMDRNNILITRGSLEFQDSWMRDILRDAQLTSKGQPAGKFRHFLRNFDPMRTNIWQYIANATDRAFRQNMFASALKEGLTEHQAAQLGRAVVLDYGRLPPKLRSTFNRVFLFIAFRLSMTVELVEALARDAPTFNRQLLAMRDSQQASTQYMLGPDYAKARIVIDPTEYVFDGTAGAVNYGPTHPAVDAYFDLARMGQFGYHAFAEDINVGQIFAQGLAEENLHPMITAAIESWVTSSLRETDKGWKVPDVWTAWAIHNGPDTMWPWFKERYNLRAVMRKRDRTPGRPTMRGSKDDAFAEWYFTDVGDMQRFKRDLMFATYGGFKRTTEDATKGLMAFYDSDYIDEKRRGNVPAFAFWTGLLTPIGARSPEELMSQALFEQKRAAQELQPKMERW
jgi:hypothetical protein